MVEKTPQFYSEAKTVFYDTIAEYLKSYRYQLSNAISRTIRTYLRGG